MFLLIAAIYLPAMLVFKQVVLGKAPKLQVNTLWCNLYAFGVLVFTSCNAFNKLVKESCICELHIHTIQLFLSKAPGVKGESRALWGNAFLFSPQTWSCICSAPTTGRRCPRLKTTWPCLLWTASWEKTWWLNSAAFAPMLFLRCQPSSTT